MATACACIWTLNQPPARDVNERTIDATSPLYKSLVSRSTARLSRGPRYLSLRLSELRLDDVQLVVALVVLALIVALLVPTLIVVTLVADLLVLGLAADLLLLALIVVVLVLTLIVVAFVLALVVLVLTLIVVTTMIP